METFIAMSDGKSHDVKWMDAIPPPPNAIQVEVNLFEKRPINQIVGEAVEDELESQVNNQLK